VGFAPDEPDLLSDFALSILSLPCKLHNFGKLILTKIIKTVTTRCQVLRLKCTKFDFDRGSAPDPTGGTYSPPPDHLAAGEEAGCPLPKTKPPLFSLLVSRP